MKSTKFNILDIILIVLIVLLLLFTLFRVFVLKNLSVGMQQRTVSYTVSVKGMDAAFSSSLAVGDTLRLLPDETECGTVADIKLTYAQGYPTLPAHIHPDKVDMTVTVTASAESVGDTTLRFADSSTLLYGDTRTFYTPVFSFTGLVTGISAE